MHAQEARRIVDRLYGYEVSPLLWHKVAAASRPAACSPSRCACSSSAERARVAFRSATWWDMEGTFAAKDATWAARLVEVGGQRLATGRDFDGPGQARQGRTCCSSTRPPPEPWSRGSGQAREGRQGRGEAVDEKPAPPFTTSTLQQEAIRKFRWTAKPTMDVAQRLYESGWITYMRTDSVHALRRRRSTPRGA